MTLREEIKIIDLLAAREAEFRVVGRCEAEISALLGGMDYPYPPLPDLPSRRPPAKKTAAKNPRAARADGPSRPVWLRGLKPESEDAYCVEYFLQDSEERQTSLLLDGEVLAAAVAMAEAGFGLCRVATVHLRADGGQEEVEVLYDSLRDGGHGAG